MRVVVFLVALLCGCDSSEPAADCASTRAGGAPCCEGAKSCGPEYTCASGLVTRDCWSCVGGEWRAIVNDDCFYSRPLDAGADADGPVSDACSETTATDAACCEGARQCGAPYTCPCGVTTMDCVQCHEGKWSNVVNDTCYYCEAGAPDAP